MCGASKASTRSGIGPWSGQVRVPVAPTPRPAISAWPNQREMCSASVTAAQTFSTGAAMCMVRRTVKVAVSTTDAELSRVVVMVVVPLGVGEPGEGGLPRSVQLKGCTSRRREVQPLSCSLVGWAQTRPRNPSTRSTTSAVAASSYEGSEESVNRWTSPG